MIKILTLFILLLTPPGPLHQVRGNQVGGSLNLPGYVGLPGRREGLGVR